MFGGGLIKRCGGCKEVRWILGGELIRRCGGKEVRRLSWISPMRHPAQNSCSHSPQLYLSCWPY